METEAKGKVEALGMKKKLEGNVIDVDCSREHAHVARAETPRNLKTHQLSLREAQAKLKAEQGGKQQSHDTLLTADRESNSNQNAPEESRTLLEQTVRARRIVDNELADINETLSPLTCDNQNTQGSKMKIEAEMATLAADLDEMAREAGMSAEKAQRAMINAARLADELHGEPATAMTM